MSAPSQVYLLAAGRGRRAGGPKAWLDREGRSLLKTQLDFLLTRFDPQRITVSIQADWFSKCRTLCERVCWIAVDPDRPPLNSLQSLIKAAPMLRWSFIYHVDQPVWEAAVWEALLDRTSGAESEALIPVFEGRRGHPVLLSHGLGPALLELDAAHDRLDSFLRTRRAAEVPVPHPCILENWNLPARTEG